MSKSKVLGGLSKFLVGSEKLSPELLASTRKYVTNTGRINQEALGKRRLLGDILIGKKGTLNALRARYAQGGLVGPGGLIMGELAMDPRYKELLKNYTNAQKGSKVLDPFTGNQVSKARATGKVVGRGLVEGLNPLFVLGFPVADILSASARPDDDPDGGMTGVLGALGSGVGFAVGGPLGLLGSLGVGMAGENLGSSLGKLVDPTKKPQLYQDSSYGNTNSPASNVILDAAIPR